MRKRLTCSPLRNNVRLMELPVRIASPCRADWNKMHGDDRVRFCGECSLSVYNFSEMDQEEIEDLLRNREGRTCARFFRRADGTMLTRDCPAGMRVKIRYVSRVAGTALSAAMGLGLAFPQSQTPSIAPQGAVRRQSKGTTLHVLMKDQTGAAIGNAEISVFRGDEDLPFATGRTST